MWRYYNCPDQIQSADCEQAICAGKNSVAEYLVKHHAFKRLYITQTLSPLESENSTEQNATYLSETTFEDASSLLEYVTKRWQLRWVTTDVWNEDILESFIRRPFFLLIGVDAPVSLRWKRLKEK